MSGTIQPIRAVLNVYYSKIIDLFLKKCYTANIRGVIYISHKDLKSINKLRKI